jgi:hypothetical protein
MGMGDLPTVSTVITLHIALFSSMTLATTKGAIFVICVGSIVVYELK